MAPLSHPICGPPCISNTVGYPYGNYLRYLRMLYAEYRKSDTYSKMRSGQSHAFVYNTRSLSEKKYCLSR